MVAPLYRPLGRPGRLSDRVADEIAELVVERRLEPGDRLPAERELGEAFAVSRTVIREAFRTLAAKGLVEVRPGGGAIVRRPSSGLVSDALSLVLRSTPDGNALAHLREVRRIVEPDLVALAAERRTDDDLRALRRQLDVMADPATSSVAWAHADVGFHTALAQAAHNPVFDIILSSIQELMLEARLLAVQLPDTRAKALRHHQSIYQAIAEGSTTAARRAMEAHLREAEATQRRAIQAAGRLRSSRVQAGQQPR
jgi:GntR family transcriptional repressor for pyruvate dehydrogenase complex